MNRSYSYFDHEGAEAVQLRDGHFESHSADEHEEYFASRPIYGDLTGDGRAEAVVHLGYDAGGTEPFCWVRVFTIHNCQVVHLASVPEDHDGLSCARNERIENGRLVVERYDMGDGNGHGSPQYVRTEYWQMRGDALAEDASARTVRRWRASDQ